jgi:hypothetical protein
MRYLFAQILLFIFSTSAFAGVKIIEIQRQGQLIPIKVFDYQNERSQREIRLETVERIPFVLGHGRDISGDGEVDTFFLYGDNALYTIPYTKMKDTFNRANMVLSLHSKNSAKEIFRNIAIHGLSYVLGSFDYGKDVRNAYFKDWMDLEELRIRIENSQNQLTKEEFLILNQVLVEGHQNAYEAMKKGFGVGFAVRSFIDAALVVSSYELLAWAGKSAMALKAGLAHGARNQTAAAMAYGLSLRLSLKTYKAKILLALRTMTVKSTLAASGRVLKSMATSNEFIYSVLQPSLQLATEVYINYRDVKDPNPLKLAKNILGHETIRMNVGVTLTDSMLRSIAEAGIKKPILRYTVLGAVGAVSSMGVGIAFEGEQDGKRAIFDGFWTVAIDNFVGAIDFATLHAFDQMAAKAKNPKLKLIGWLIVGASAVSNSYGYNRSVDYIENENFSIKLIPVEVMTD